MYGQEITVKAETLEQLFNAAHAGVLHLVCERIFSWQGDPHKYVPELHTAS